MSDAIKAVVLADLDDTLFQTRAKCDPRYGDALEPMSLLADGSPSGYTTPVQRGLLALFDDCLLVPVTARSREVLGRVKLAYRTAVCANGGCILRDDGGADASWHAHLAACAARGSDSVEAVFAAIDAAVAGHAVRRWIVAEDGLACYVVLKHDARDEAALGALLRHELAARVPAGWRTHLNGNNLAISPPWLSKRAAVAHLLEELRETYPDRPVIGIGDSLSDAGFIDLCDYAMQPTGSQLWAAATTGNAWVADEVGADAAGDRLFDAAGFSGSYAATDVTFLMKPVQLQTIDVAAKERLIQSGARHYSEMLSPENVPDERYLELYRLALARNARRLNADIAALAQRVRDRHGESLRIVSLARAGTPIGVLLHRRLRRLGVASTHYSISIIRGRGIDRVALAHIERRHGAAHTVFVDGWTGKGAITDELRASLAGTAFELELAVVADPAGCASYAATVDDYVIPSGLLNGIVSGLVSRSVLNDAVVGPGDFHACLFLERLAPHDLSLRFIEAIEAAAPEPCGTPWTEPNAARARAERDELVRWIRDDAGVADVNRVKPGIAEATRALLRRVPDALYLAERDDPEVAHLALLAQSADVPVRELPRGPYRAVTLIKQLGDPPVNPPP